MKQISSDLPIKSHQNCRQEKYRNMKKKKKKTAEGKTIQFVSVTYQFEYKKW